MFNIPPPGSARRLILPAIAAISALRIAAQVVHPSLTEINLGPVPFGQYNSTANPGPMDGCSIRGLSWFEQSSFL
jgi:hypothetical protein